MSSQPPAPTYRLTVEQKPGYLHAIVTGSNTQLNVAAYLDELLGRCLAGQCYRVLIEERLEGPRLRTVEVFEIASRGAQKVAGVMRAIAYVDRNAAGDLMRFAETAAINRGVPVMIFPTVADAEAWIRPDAACTGT
jgi:hypothetical protein